VTCYLYRFGSWLMHLFMVQVEVQVGAWLMNLFMVQFNYRLVHGRFTCLWYRLITS
jgi:hypothetical protein